MWSRRIYTPTTRLPSRRPPRTRKSAGRSGRGPQGSCAPYSLELTLTDGVAGVDDAGVRPRAAEDVVIPGDVVARLQEVVAVASLQVVVALASEDPVVLVVPLDLVVVIRLTLHDIRPVVPGR